MEEERPVRTPPPKSRLDLEEPCTHSRRGPLPLRSSHLCREGPTQDLCPCPSSPVGHRTRPRPVTYPSVCLPDVHSPSTRLVVFPVSPWFCPSDYPLPPVLGSEPGVQTLSEGSRLGPVGRSGDTPAVGGSRDSDLRTRFVLTRPPTPLTRGTFFTPVRCVPVSTRFGSEWTSTFGTHVALEDHVKCVKRISLFPTP